jgi:hypothetical protein
VSAGKLLLALTQVGGLSACQDEMSRDDGFAATGLTETALGRPQINEAIDLANSIIERRDAILRAAWSPRLGNEIAVYAVARDGLGRREIIFVPPGCRCVAVQAVQLNAWLLEHTSVAGRPASLDKSAALAFMLAHEVGHIVHGDWAALLPATASAAWNEMLTAQKKREVAADRFAAGMIAAALSHHGDRGLAGARVSLALSELSYIMSAHRIIDHFGGTGTHARSLFWDDGYTHPNFELRILTVNHLIRDDRLSSRLMQEFLDHRERRPIAVYAR